MTIVTAKAGAGITPTTCMADSVTSGGHEDAMEKWSAWCWGISWRAVNVTVM